MVYVLTKKHRSLYPFVCGLLVSILWLWLAGPALAEEDQASPPPQAPPVVDTVPYEPQVIIKTDVHYAMDFPYVKAIAPNSVAWLYQPGTGINHPVMFNESDNSYYFKRQFNDSINYNGSLFMKGDKAPNFSQPVTTLYGVNCMDNSLFGSLSLYYREDSYYALHPTFYLLTPTGDYQLDIFAGIKTKVSDKTSWAVSQTSLSTLYKEDLPRILESSFIPPISANLPREGDAWAVFTTDAYNGQGNRYVIYARKRPIQWSTENIIYLNKMDMDSRETLNGPVTLPNGIGTFMVYAQNDISWKSLTFEMQNSRLYRNIGDGGCGPTSIAMAIANLVGKEELSKIRAFSNSPFGYRFCACSVNDHWCSKKHITYQVTTDDEYLRYFPLVIASFATGNNIWEIKGRVARFGSSMSYLDELCEIYDITLEQTNNLQEAIAFIKNENCIAISCTAGGNNPFTKTSHFVVLAGADDEYLYVLDPFRRDSYARWDSQKYVEMLFPGVVRIKLDNATQCHLAPIYLLKKNVK